MPLQQHRAVHELKQAERRDPAHPRDEKQDRHGLRVPGGTDAGNSGGADNKTISKWARALRYVARCKKPGTPLKAFMTEAGGVNACANLYARYFGRARRGSVR
jgi:hypothetical protein